MSRILNRKVYLRYIGVCFCCQHFADYFRVHKIIKQFHWVPFFKSILKISQFSIKNMWNTAVGIKNCKQLFSLRLALTTQKKATHTAEMMSVLCVAIFWVVNASSSEQSCLQFSIPTGSGAGGEGGVSHRLKRNVYDAIRLRENWQSKQMFGQIIFSHHWHWGQKQILLILLSQFRVVCEEFL